MNQPFVPCGVSGKKLACTATTARVILPTSGDTLRVCNLGTNKAFIELGTVAIEAVKDTGMCILPSSSVIIGRNIASETYIAGVCDSAETCTLYIQAGYGGL